MQDSWLAARRTALDELRVLSQEREGLERAVADAIAARTPAHVPHHRRSSDHSAEAGAAHQRTGSGSAATAGAAGVSPSPRVLHTQNSGSSALGSAANGGPSGAAAAERTSSPEELEEVEREALCHEAGRDMQWRFGAAAVAPLGIAFDRLKRNLCLERRCFLRLHETIAKQVSLPSCLVRAGAP